MSTEKKALLREVRERKGIKQAVLANMANVSVSTVWRAEHGEKISRVNAWSICNALGIDLSEVDIPIVGEENAKQ